MYGRRAVEAEEADEAEARRRTAHTTAPSGERVASVSAGRSGDGRRLPRGPSCSQIGCCHFRDEMEGRLQRAAAEELVPEGEGCAPEGAAACAAAEAAR
jgi:hypothetical protein